VANEWCVAIEADTPDAAEAAADLLCLYKLEAESTGERVLCVADSRDRAATLARRIAAILPETPYPDELGEPAGAALERGAPALRCLRHIDVGAWDEADALSVATQARDVRGVRDAVPSPL
jgi:hypothetical protein